MANSNDGSSSGSGKGPQRPGVDSAPRKPSALIDLKPTEVDIRDPKPAAAQTGAASSKAASAVAGAAAEAAAKVVGSPPGASSGQGTSGAAKPVAAGGASAAGAASSHARPSTSASLPPASSPIAAPASGGLRGAATHLAAGLAGGLLALLGAEAMMPSGGSQPGPDRKAMQTLETRLQLVEAASSRPQPVDASATIAALEQRLAQMERAAAQVSEQQTRLAGETQQIGARLAAQPTGSAADIARITRLEEILKSLSAAANDPQAGRIPQLASINGRLVDLEASVAAQIAALRKGVTTDVESRLGQSNEAAQAARAGTQRLDRELSGLKTEAAQASQRLDAVKSQADRAEVSLRGLRDETSALKAEVGGVRESLQRELAQVARPNDVSSALSPLSSKLSLLEQNVQGVVRGEDDRRANVERIVVALELGNLKRTVERGAGFGTELAEVRRIAGSKVDLSALERFKDRGVTSTAELERDFRSLAFRIVEADAQPADAHWTERLIASAKSVVRVRRVDQTADDKSAEATVARIEQALKAGRLGDVTSEAGKLSDKARAPAAGWLEKVGARAAVDRAIALIEQELKSSLAIQSQTGKKG